MTGSRFSEMTDAELDELVQGVVAGNDQVGPNLGRLCVPEGFGSNGAGCEPALLGQTQQQLHFEPCAEDRRGVHTKFQDLIHCGI